MGGLIHQLTIAFKQIYVSKSLSSSRKLFISSLLLLQSFSINANKQYKLIGVSKTESIKRRTSNTAT